MNKHEYKNAWRSAPGFRFCLMLMLFAFAFWCRPKAAAATGVAVVSALEGKVDGMTPGGNQWAALSLKSKLSEGHKIRTGAGSRAVIAFNDGSVIKMNSLSTISIMPNPRLPEKMNVNLTSGEMWVRAREQGKVNQVSTPQALCGVRGTEFNVNVTDAESTLTVVFGQVEFSNEFGRVMVADSQQSAARPGQPPSPPRIVDPNRWIEWTLDLEAAGLFLEEPYFLEPPRNLLSRLNALDPQSDPEKLLEAGKIAIDLRDYEKASAALNQAASLAPEDAEILIALGRLKLLSGDRPGAAEVLKKALELKPGDSGAIRSWAQLELLNRKYDAALDMLKDSDSADPLNSVMRGLVLLRIGSLKDAEDAFQTALKAETGCFQAYQGLALLLLYGNDFSAALQSAERAAAIYAYSSQTGALIANIYFYRGDIKNAQTAALEALKLNPSEAAALDILSRSAVVQNNLDVALGFALQALAADESNPFARDALGRVQELELKSRAAESQYRKALELYPDYLQARIDLVNLLAAARRFQAARTEADEALKIHPDDDRLVGLRGQISMAAGEFDNAKADFLAAVKLNPRRATHHGNLAVIAIEENDMRAAADSAQKAVDLEPGFPHYHEILGAVYERIGNTEGAMSEYREALKLDPDYAQARYRMGILLAQEGKVRGAVAETSMAILRDPRVMTFAAYRGDAGLSVQTSKNLRESGKLIWADSYMDMRLQTRFSYLSARPDGWRENGDERRDTAAFYVGFRPDFRSGWFLMTDYMVLDQGQPRRADVETLTLIPNQRPGTASGLPANDPDDRIETLYRRINLGYRRLLSPRHEVLLRFSNTAGSRRTWYLRDNYYVAPNYVNPAAVFNLYDDFRDTYREYEFRGDLKLDRDLTLAYGYNRVDSRIRERIQYSFFNPNTGALLAEGSGFLPNRFRQWSLWAQAQKKLAPDFWVSISGEWLKHNLAGKHNLYVFAADWKLDEAAWMHFLARKQVRLSFYPQLMPRQDWAAVEDFDSVTPGQVSTLYELDYERRFPDQWFLKAAGFSRTLDNRSLGVEGFPIARRTLKQGLQLTVEKQLADDLNAFMQYAWARERIRTPDSANYGNTAAYSPRGRGSLGLYFLPDKHSSLALRLRTFGSRYTTDANVATLESVTLGDLVFQYNFDLHLNLNVTVTNIGDKEYEDPEGYPADRRRFTTSVNLYF